MIIPACDEILSLSGEYDIIPICREIYADVVTPITLLRRIAERSSRFYLLESIEGGEKWGRYSFLGYNPVMRVACHCGKVKIESHVSRFPSREIQTDHPMDVLREILAQFKAPRLKGQPPFTGGFVGYFAYAMIEYAEPTLHISRGGANDFDLMLFDKVIAFDHLRQKLILMVNMSLDEPETSYNKAVLELRQLVELLRTGAKKQDRAGRLLGPVTPLFGREDFSRMVEQAKVHIREGDIFQIVLSNCLSAPFEGSLFNTYRVLRTLNPSPYMFYFSGTDVEVAGASPETLVKLENGVLHTFPLAGTRPRGKTPEEDQVLETELLSDEKELAEHNMLVDLGRNDLGKISRFGTVQVEKFHTIERFSHVMHIGSTVRGELREDKDALDAIEAVLPAGTLSGAPKLRACQLIAELENNKRGIYGGAIGYIDFTGNMDTCIAIRIAYQKNGRVFVRSGAGIVADSVPEQEFEECMNKARASLRALELAQEAEL